MNWTMEFGKTQKEKSVSDDKKVFWFGKHEGKHLDDVPSGYLRWMVENFDPVPLPKDTMGKSQEEVKAMETRMREFMSAANDVVEEREKA